MMKSIPYVRRKQNFLFPSIPICDVPVSGRRSLCVRSEPKQLPLPHFIYINKKSVKILHHKLIYIICECINMKNEIKCRLYYVFFCQDAKNLVEWEFYNMQYVWRYVETENQSFTLNVKWRSRGLVLILFWSCCQVDFWWYVYMAVQVAHWSGRWCLAVWKSGWSPWCKQ